MIAADRARPLKRPLGPLAYAVGALRAGGDRQARCAAASTVDGDELFAGEAWQVIVAGTGAFGGGSELDAADPADRLVDVAVLEGGPRLALVRRAWGMRRGGLTEQPGVHHAPRARDRARAAAPRRRSTSTARSATSPRCASPRAASASGSCVREGPRALRLARRARGLGAAWYASESLRHRREQGHGYELRGGTLDVGEREFLHAAEALTAAPISDDNDVDLLINGDRIFPGFVEAIERRAVDDQPPHLRLLAGRHRPRRRRAALPSGRSDGLEVNVLLDWVGTAKMERDLIDEMERRGRHASRASARCGPTPSGA